MSSSPAGSAGAQGPVRYLDLPRPEPGRAVEVAPGILWARVPLPFKLDHVNVWLLDLSSRPLGTQRRQQAV